jgi:hypothetical protein
MPNSPKRARKTYTRRTVKQKFEDAIDEIKTLITRHCGVTEGLVTKAANAAAEQTAARLTPMLATGAAGPSPSALPVPNMFNMNLRPLSLVSGDEEEAPAAISKAQALKALAAKKGRVAEPPATIAKPKKMTCPGGPALYNKFILTTMKKLKEMEVDLPYQEVKGLAGAYWTKVKSDICFSDESGELLQEFAQKAAESIATGAENTSNYNQLVQETRALQGPKPNKAAATQKLPKVVKTPNAAANFAKKAGLPNLNFSTIKTAGAAATRKVKLQLPGKAPITPGRNTPPKTLGASALGAGGAAAAAQGAKAAAANYDPFANLFGSPPTPAPAPTLGSGAANVNLLGLGGPSAGQAPLRPAATAKAPVSIGASMPTPTTNAAANNSVKEVNINGKKYFMNVATKGLYEKDEETNSFGPWVGYRQNNGTIRFTNAPEE